MCLADVPTRFSIWKEPKPKKLPRVCGPNASPRADDKMVARGASARFRSRVIRRSEFISRFVFSREVKTLLVPILVGLFPIGLTLRIVRGNWTSVPYGDEWWTPGRQIISFFHGTLRFADLFQQHNESRKLFPNLYYLGLVAATGRWDVKQEMVLMLALACLGSVLLFVLLRWTTTFSLPGSLWAWAILNFVFFCPREYENFLWGIQLEPLTPGVALVAAMLVNVSQIRLRWKTLANSALALVATYSYANGMLLWLLAAPIYPGRQLARTQSRGANPAGWYVFYALCCILSVGFYFHHYIRPADYPPFAVSMTQPVPLLRFFLSWLGSLFAVPGADPLFFGCFFLAIYVALVVAAIRVARREGNFRRSYAWVVIAAYALLSGAIVSLGRMHFGINSATAPRYAVVVVFFCIGLAGLAASLYEVWIRRAAPQRGSRLVFASGFTIGLFVAGWLSSFNIQLARVSVIRAERKDLALAVQWIPAIPDNPDLALAEVPPKVVAEKAIALSNYDALRPRLIPQSLASAVRQNPAQGDPSAGMLGSARFSEDRCLLLTGTAWLPYRNARADCVIVGYQNSDGGLTPFTVLEPTYMRERLKRRFDIRRLPTNGFAAIIDPANLPMEALTLRAWAVDLRAKRAFPMAGGITVENQRPQRN
jgi:hypothetical protein